MRQRLWRLLVLFLMVLPALGLSQSVPINSNLVVTGHINSCLSTTGTVNAYGCDLEWPITAYQPQACYQFIADTTNTGPTTINFQSLGAISIKKLSAGSLVDLVANDIGTGRIAQVCFDGMDMQLMSQAGTTVSGLAPLTLSELNTAVTDADVVSQGGPESVANKRLEPRYRQLSAASGTVTAPDCTAAGGDIYYRYGVTGTLTIPACTGTPVPGQAVLFIVQSETPQTLVFSGGAQGFAAAAQLPLPSTTTGDVGGNNVYDHFSFVFNLDSNTFIYVGGSRATGPCALEAGCTGSALSDPGGHRLLGWDDTDNAMAFFTLGAGLSYDPPTNTVSATGGAPASETVAGIVELATAAETSTGTDAGRAVTPDGLAGSDYGKRFLVVECIPDATALTTGDGKCYIPIELEFNGWIIVAVRGRLGAAVSSSGAVTFDVDVCGVVATGIRCSGTNRDLLTTNGTIDANESRTTTAATPLVINTANDDVATDEVVRVNIDGAGTGAQGFYVTIVLQKP